MKRDIKPKNILEEMTVKDLYKGDQFFVEGECGCLFKLDSIHDTVNGWEYYASIVAKNCSDSWCKINGSYRIDGNIEVLLAPS